MLDYAQLTIDEIEYLEWSLDKHLESCNEGLERIDDVVQGHPLIKMGRALIELAKKVGATEEDFAAKNIDLDKKIAEVKADFTAGLSKEITMVNNIKTKLSIIKNEAMQVTQ